MHCFKQVYTPAASFEHADGRNDYQAMLDVVWFQNWGFMGLNEMLFQQDEATCHTARQTIDLVRSWFGGRTISRNCPGNQAREILPFQTFSCGVDTRSFWSMLMNQQQLTHWRTTFFELWLEASGKVCQDWAKKYIPLAVNIYHKSVLIWYQYSTHLRESHPI